MLRKRPQSHADRELIPEDRNKKQDEQRDTQRLQMYFFPIQVKEDDIGNDGKDTEKLEVQVHGKKNG